MKNLTISRKIKRIIIKAVIVILKGIMFVFCPIKAVGKENIPRDRGVLICPNHVSIFDIFCIYLTYYPGRLHFMAKAELFDKPIKRYFMDFAEAFPVVRGNGGGSAIEYSIDLINQNESICLFVEGTRTKNSDCSPGKAKAGAVLIASQTNCDIVPVAICYKHGKPRIFCTNYVYYGQPIDSSQIKVDSKSKADLRASSEKVMGAIVDLWKQGKSRWQK